MNVHHAHGWLSPQPPVESSDPSAAAAAVGHQARWSREPRVEVGRDLAPYTVRIRRRPAENYRVLTAVAGRTKVIVDGQRT